MTPSPDGVLVVDKPAGPTSHDVVSVARRVLGTPRVGHTGTLDPLATGVLPLVVGRATRLAQFMMGAEKEYVATVIFGRSTDTYDAEGATVDECGGYPTLDALRAAVMGLVGPMLQTPPVYSAKKIGGQPSYRLARQAKAVTPAAVAVTLHEATVESVEGPAARVRLRVSSGFYVRSLAHDLGRQLGMGAYLGALRRLRSGPFDEAAAISWEGLVAGDIEIGGAMISIDRLLTDLPHAVLSGDAVAGVRHGRSVQAVVDNSRATGAGGPVRLVDEQGRLVAIASVSPASSTDDAGARTLRPVVVLG